MRHALLPTALLVATALAGVASADGPCSNGTTPVGVYGVCVLQYDAYAYDVHYVVGGSYIYDIHRAGEGSSNTPVDAGATAGPETAGMTVRQSKSSDSTRIRAVGFYQYFETTEADAQRSTDANVRTSHGSADVSQSSWTTSYEYYQFPVNARHIQQDCEGKSFRVAAAGVARVDQASFKCESSPGGTTSGKFTGATAGSLTAGQRVTNGSCTIESSAGVSQPCGPVPVAPDVPEIPDFPLPPI